MYLFYFLAAIIVLLGLKSLRGGFAYLRFFERELPRQHQNFTPFASILVPCRGLDQDVAENLASLFRQDYPRYEIIFAVDDDRDDAVEEIEKLRSRFVDSVRSKLVNAGKSRNEGQKVHNLRCAVLEVSVESEVLVFVDSDARPANGWLANLVAPLKDERIGCATGYRWFIAGRGGFFSQMRSVWNASIASALGENTDSNFCWGGSTAIRVETFERLKIRDRLKGALSDDFIITRTLKEACLPIHFVPQCLTATLEECGFRELLEFTTRQMKITKVYAPYLWKASFIGSALFTITFWGGAVLLMFLSGRHFAITLMFTLTIAALGCAKAWLRLKAVKLALQDYREELDRSLIWHLMLWMITPALYLYNCVAALLSRKILWRGIEYSLKSPNEIEITGRRTAKN